MKFGSTDNGNDEAKNVGVMLKEHGIVTATDLVYSFKAYQERQSTNDVFIDTESDNKIQIMLDAMMKDSNMYHVMAWHSTGASLPTDSLFFENNRLLSDDEDRILQKKEPGSRKK